MAMTRTHLCLVKVSSMMNFMFASLAAAVGHYNTIVIVAAVSAAYTAKCLFRSSFLTVKCQQPSILMLIAELFPYFSVTKTARLDRFCILISRSLNHYSEMAASLCNCNSHHPARCWGGAVTVTGNMLSAQNSRYINIYLQMVMWWSDESRWRYRGVPDCGYINSEDQDTIWYHVPAPRNSA